MLAFALLAARMTACGAPGRMLVPLATRRPTRIPPLGEASPGTNPGEPTAPQSRADDPLSAEGVTADDGVLPDPLFANLLQRPMEAEGALSS